MAYRNSLNRNGLTLVEVIVVVFVIVVLISLLLPAVISVRDSARKAGCLSNLSQIGLALTNYQSALGVFPPSVNASKGYSVFSMILNYSEHQNVYNSINFSLRHDDPVNQTVSRTQISMFACPANTVEGFDSQFCNYTCTVGYGFQLPNQHEGVFGINPVAATTPASVSDGLSSTINMSEWVVGSVKKELAVNMSNSYFIIPSLPFAKSFEEFNSKCISFQPDKISSIWIHKGRNWIRTGLGYTLYNHNVTPNNNSCLNGTMTREGSWTASSYHRGAVHVLFADGHAQSVSDKIHSNIWRALGTKNGGESIPDVFQ